MAIKITKDSLFQTFFQHLNKTSVRWEMFFALSGMRTQLFGTDAQEWELDSAEVQVAQEARARIKSSYAWSSLSELCDYALDGVLPEALAPEDVVLRGAEVLNLAGADDDESWQHIVAMGDARFALDDGDELSIANLAMLARVDERTVRNAISAGALQADKAKGETFVMNASARNWLSSRRGFKSTRSAKVVDLSQVRTPAEFGALLVDRRTALHIDSNQKQLLAFHPLVTPRQISALEEGTFRLPIDTVFPLADYYQLDRRAFLATVMRVFFPEELMALDFAPAESQESADE